MLSGLLLAALVLSFFVLGPIYALIVAFLVGLGLLAVAALRRSDEAVDGTERERVRRDTADRVGAASADRGAPHTGGPQAAPTGPLPASPEGPGRGE